MDEQSLTGLVIWRNNERLKELEGLFLLNFGMGMGSLHVPAKKMDVINKP